MVSDAQNILVTHIAGLTQTTLALPALRSLRHHFPKSRITIVSSAMAADLLTLAGTADEILPLARLRQADLLKPGTIYRSAKVIHELRGRAYDLVIEFEANTESGIILRLVNARTRLNRPVSKGMSVILERLARALRTQPPKLIHAAHDYLKILEPL